MYHFKNIYSTSETNVMIHGHCYQSLLWYCFVQQHTKQAKYATIGMEFKEIKKERTNVCQKYRSVNVSASNTEHSIILLSTHIFDAVDQFSSLGVQNVDSITMGTEYVAAIRRHMHLPTSVECLYLVTYPEATMYRKGGGGNMYHVTSICHEKVPSSSIHLILKILLMGDEGYSKGKK